MPPTMLRRPDSASHGRLLPLTGVIPIPIRNASLRCAALRKCARRSSVSSTPNQKCRFESGTNGAAMRPARVLSKPKVQIRGLTRQKGSRSRRICTVGKPESPQTRITAPSVRYPNLHLRFYEMPPVRLDVFQPMAAHRSAPCRTRLCAGAAPFNLLSSTYPAAYCGDEHLSHDR